MRLIINLFESGNVSVSGLRGTGKDLLFGNVIARRKKPYVSNLDYTGDDLYHLLDFNLIDCGRNTYDNLLSGDIRYYEYPYPMGSDIYVSDAGIYLPAQYCNELNKKYPFLATYAALSRQCSRNNFHTNTQQISRTYDKLREQSDIYILCRKCFYFHGLVIQLVTIYDKYDSCVARVKPCRVHLPLFPSREQRLQYSMYKDNFFNSHGDIRNHWLIYFNKSKHDTYYFEKLFKGGKKNEECKFEFVSGLKREHYR